MSNWINWWRLIGHKAKSHEPKSVSFYDSDVMRRAIEAERKSVSDSLDECRPDGETQSR